MRCKRAHTVRGGTTSIQGFGFGAGESVRLWWGNPRELLETIVVDNQGTFVGDRAERVTIPSGAAVGRNVVIAVGQVTRAIETGTINVH